jgi:hypothetical protein
MQVVLVMEYAPNGDLFSKLEKAHKEQVPPPHLLKSHAHMAGPGGLG